MALTVVIVFLALAAFVYIRHLQAKTSTAAQAPACLLAQRFAQREHDGIFASNSTALHHRIIAVGDVHGSLDGLLEDIHAAGLVSGPKSCEWVIQKAPTILVQLGDIVDRGSQALEALICLKKLQDEAPQYNARVIRLVGSKYSH